MECQAIRKKHGWRMENRKTHCWELCAAAAAAVKRSSAPTPAGKACHWLQHRTYLVEYFLLATPREGNFLTIMERDKEKKISHSGSRANPCDTQRRNEHPRDGHFHLNA